MTQKGNVSVGSRDDLYVIMDNGEPYKSYIKTILGKVHVVAWDHFKDVSVGMLLTGDPRKHEESSIIDIWTQKEDVHFTRMNKKHLEQGVLIPYKRPVTEVKERTFEESTDEELIDILNSKFFTLKARMDKTESEAILFRLLTLAQEQDKSEAITKAIEARISEIQESKYVKVPSTLKEEI